MAFNLEAFFGSVFAPKNGELVVIMYDEPHHGCGRKDHEQWRDRRRIAQEWRDALAILGHKVGFKPLIASYPATGQDNGNLPVSCSCHARTLSVTNISALLREADIVIAMPEFSATAPLHAYVKDGRLRVGSMPGLTRAMLDTGLSADYGKIKRRCDAILPLMQKAIAASVVFSTGHAMYFDLRYNEAHGDDGDLRAPGKLTNLPAGEVYKVPFEGSATEQSRTSGRIPFMVDGALHILSVKNNQIVGCDIGGQAVDLDKLFGNADPACRNIAEFAIGVNDGATLIGNTLQDEKALGIHWARGRSEHLGGTVGPAQFLDPKNIIHQDYVYPIRGARITVEKAELFYSEGGSKILIRDGQFF